MANAVNKAASFAAIAEKTKSQAKLNAYRQALKHLKKQLIRYLKGIEEIGLLNEIYLEAKIEADKELIRSKKK